MISLHMITDQGYEVFGCEKFVSPQGSLYISGRLRLEKGNPTEDLIQKWDMSFKPIGHNYGSLQHDTRKQKVFGEANGFNMFRGLTAK